MQEAHYGRYSTALLVVVGSMDASSSELCPRSNAVIADRDGDGEGLTFAVCLAFTVMILVPRPITLSCYVLYYLYSLVRADNCFILYVQRTYPVPWVVSGG